MATSAQTPTASEPSENNISIPVIKTREGAITKVTGDGLTGPNWVSWQVRMKSLLALCEVEPYVRGEINQPNMEDDPTGHNNWKKNDNYAKHLITQNVSDEAIIHIQYGSTSHVAWKNLEAIYEDKSQETAVAVIRNLWHTTAEEDDDINEHLTNMKKYWERLNLVEDERFRIAEVQFKIAIVSSLPSSWDNFTQPYISIGKDESSDPKLRMTSQELIGVLKEEYVRRQRRAGKLQKDDMVNQVTPGKPSLLGRMNTNTQPCDTCGLHNHVTRDCKFKGQPKCGICNRFGHTSDECYSRKAKALKRKREKNDGKGKGKKKKKNEQMNVGEEDDDEEEEHVTCFLQDYSDIPLDESEIGQSFNLDKCDVLTNEYNPPLIYYDWLGDSATTSHVCNQREAFKTFHPLTTTVSGVGNAKIRAKGKGTVELRSSYKGQKYIIELKDVLYIPTNRNNLISLGKWDKAGGTYKGGQGELILIANNGKPVT